MSAPTYVPMALADLNARRVGSRDVDETVWREGRAHAATATAIRDVWLEVEAGLSLEDAAERVARKRLADRGGSGPEARWGDEREPALVAEIRDVEATSWSYHAPHNSRHMASPDGVGYDYDEQLVLAEVKTGAPRYFGAEGMRAKGYHVQIAWAMFVAGAVRTHYRFEERLGTRTSGFEPGAVFAPEPLEWAECAEFVHDDLVPMADALLAAIDRLLDDVDASADPLLDVLALDVLRGRELEAEALALKDEAWKKLLAIGAERGVRIEQESGFARVLYTPAVTTTSSGTRRVVDESHEDVVAARQAVVDAQAALAVVEDEHSSVEPTTATTTKKASLTVSDPQRRKGKS